MQEFDKQIFLKEYDCVFFRNSKGRAVRNEMKRNPEKCTDTCESTKVLSNIMNTDANCANFTEFDSRNEDSSLTKKKSSRF